MEDSELVTAYHAMSALEGKKIRAFFPAAHPERGTISIAVFYAPLEPVGVSPIRTKTYLLHSAGNLQGRRVFLSISRPTPLPSFYAELPSNADLCSGGLASSSKLVPGV